MNIRQLSLYSVIAVVSGAAGAWSTWTQPETAAATVPAIASGTPAAAARPSAESAPLISVSSYGTVTLRVEQLPLEWVLDEIARQSGDLDVKNRAGAGRQPVAAVARPDSTAACATVNAGAPTTTLLQAIAQGTEDERYSTLLRARSDSLPLPEDTLKRLYENDASDRVRSIAFQRFLEGRTGSIEEMQKALEAGLAVPNEAIRTEARRRLDSLLDGEGFDTSLQ